MHCRYFLGYENVQSFRTGANKAKPRLLPEAAHHFQRVLHGPLVLEDTLQALKKEILFGERLCVRSLLTRR